MTRWYLKFTSQNGITEYAGPSAIYPDRLRWSEHRGSVSPFLSSEAAHEARKTHKGICKLEGCKLVVIRVAS